VNRSFGDNHYHQTHNHDFENHHNLLHFDDDQLINVLVKVYYDGNRLQSISMILVLVYFIRLVYSALAFKSIGLNVIAIELIIKEMTGFFSLYILIIIIVSQLIYFRYGQFNSKMLTNYKALLYLFHIPIARF